VRGLGLLIVALASVTGIVFAIDSHLDLQVTSLFFDAASHRFPAASDAVAIWLRGKSNWIFVGCAVAVGATAAARLLIPGRLHSIPAKPVVFLALTLALGPGLLVNGLLKEHWSRPRPGEVVEFGGTLPFVPWWDPRGLCTSNCSFVSGETSGAAWTVAPALLVPGAFRVVALGAAGVFTLVVGALRLAAGGHFLSDVLFAIALTLAVIWAIYRLVFQTDWTRFTKRMAARLGRTELNA
jgi:membrane-associated phospholipid phosphatase